MSTEVTGVVELVILKGPRVERLSAGVVRYGVFLFKMTKDTVWPFVLLRDSDELHTDGLMYSIGKREPTRDQYPSLQKKKKEVDV